MFCKTVPLKYKFILKRVNSKIFVQNSCILIQNVLGYLHLENLKGGKKMSRTHCNCKRLNRLYTGGECFGR